MKQQKKSAAKKQQPPPVYQNNNEGVFSSFGRVVQNAMRDLDRGLVEMTNRFDKEISHMSISSGNAEGKFQTEFMLPPTDKLLDSFGCNALSGTLVIPGTCFLSMNNFAFYAKQFNQCVKVLIPWTNILKINKVQKVSSVHDPVPQFAVVPPQKAGDGVQFVTADNKLHHFWGLTKGLLNEPFPQFFNLLNYAHGNATRNQNVGQDNAKEEKPEKKKKITT